VITFARGGFIPAYRSAHTAQGISGVCTVKRYRLLIFTSHSTTYHVWSRASSRCRTLRRSRLRRWSDWTTQREL